MSSAGSGTLRHVSFPSQQAVSGRRGRPGGCDPSLLCLHCPQLEDNDLYDAIALGLQQTSLGLEDPPATATPTGAPGKASSPCPPPKSQVSFPHTKNSIYGSPRNVSKELSMEVRRILDSGRPHTGPAGDPRVACRAMHGLPVASRIGSHLAWLGLCSWVMWGKSPISRRPVCIPEVPLELA